MCSKGIGEIIHQSLFLLHTNSLTMKRKLKNLWIKFVEFNQELANGAAYAIRR